MKLTLICQQCGDSFVEKRVSSRARFCGMRCVKLSQKGVPLSDPVERFMKNVEKVGDCWMWTASTKYGGYGKLQYLGKQRGAHRVSLALFKGFDIESPLCALHTCDTPRCVNPVHLFLGTQKDNMRDASRKGRCVRLQDWRGTKNPKAKLTDEQTLEVVAKIKGGMSYADAATLFGVTNVRVGQIYRAALCTPSRNGTGVGLLMKTSDQSAAPTPQTAPQTSASSKSPSAWPAVCRTEA